jgi:lysophospholipase L1-like esterase
MLRFTCLVLLFLTNKYCFSQTIKWDDTQSKDWPEAFKKAMVPSSIPSEMAQPTIIYSTTSPTPQPLIVSLHSWSGDFMQSDSLALEIMERNWNYIHPNFRGPNNNSLAAGSDIAVQDIDDAIQYAIKNCNVNTKEVHIIGSSGGGHMAMMCYMKLKYPAKSFNAWVGISSLEDWYYESVSRGQKYAKEILQIGGDTLRLNTAAIKKHSPINYTPPIARKNTPLNIYAGIHDGYWGSVPITQSIKMYNKLVKLKKDAKNIVSAEDINELLSKRSFPTYHFQFGLGNRKIHYTKKSAPYSLTIFEGKHEMIVRCGLALLPIENKKTMDTTSVFCIGDSNGEIETGWPKQLQFEWPSAKIINICKSGNTIGFDNLGEPGLNELKSVDAHIAKCKNDLNSRAPNIILIQLGTNDTKVAFIERQREIPQNLKLLVAKLRANFPSAIIAVLSPPPIGFKLTEGAFPKFDGSQKRVADLQPEYKKTCIDLKIDFINTYDDLKKNMDGYFFDSIHFTNKGSSLVARLINAHFNK